MLWCLGRLWLWCSGSYRITVVLQDVAEKPFASISYTEAVKVLQKSKAKFEFPVEWGADLQSEHERYLTEKEFQGTPVMVTDYPKAIKVAQTSAVPPHVLVMHAVSLPTRLWAVLRASPFWASRCWLLAKRACRLAWLAWLDIVGLPFSLITVTVQGKSACAQK